MYLAYHNTVIFSVVLIRSLRNGKSTFCCSYNNCNSYIRDHDKLGDIYFIKGILKSLFLITLIVFETL